VTRSSCYLGPVRSFLPLLVAIPSFLAACQGTTTGGGDSPVDSEPQGETDVTPDSGPVLVYFTVDTLSATAAAQGDWCGRIHEILGRHGLDVACVDGGMSPSSWTGEAHTRMLWPQHGVGSARADWHPVCDDPGALGDIAAALDASYTWGADNPMLGTPNSYACDGVPSWHQGTDSAYEPDAPPDGPPPPEDQRPGHFAITDLLAATEGGAPAVAFVNSLEVGGHFPRCWFDPQTPGCEAMWQIALAAGAVQPDDDPADAWTSLMVKNKTVRWAETQMTDQEVELRSTFWDTMIQSIEYYRVELFDDRLERILSGLEAQGRLGDLTLVVVGDHGENPCVAHPERPELNCAHGNTASEYTALVPVFVSPASLADDWRSQGLIGANGEVFSTTNLAYGLMDRFAVPVPSDWPEPSPPGGATSWTCNGTQGGAGLRVEGNQSLRCEGDACGAFDWVLPTDGNHFPTALTEIPPIFADYQGTPTWFEQACH
jgi:hypothetical protein